MEIEANLAALRSRIAAACERSGRDPALVRIIGATKRVPAPLVQAAIDAGLRDVGENRVQEAVAKKAQIATADVTWHLIGHLQRNKVPAALATFDIIQSVDSVGLAEALDRRVTGKLRILLEVNVGQETSKFGFARAEVEEAVRAMQRMPNLELVGLMTVAPAVRDPETARPVFRELRELALAHGLEELSMGMSDDFEVAVQEGSTMVRIGRALFGERQA